MLRYNYKYISKNTEVYIFLKIKYLKVLKMERTFSSNSTFLQELVTFISMKLLENFRFKSYFSVLQRK